MHYLHGRCCHGTEFNRSVNRLGMFEPCLVRGTCFTGCCTAPVHGCPAMTWVTSGSSFTTSIWTRRRPTKAPLLSFSVPFSFFMSPFLSLHFYFPSVPYSFNPSPHPPLFSSPHFNLLVFIPLLLLPFSFSSSSLSILVSFCTYFSYFHCTLLLSSVLNLLYLQFFFLSFLISIPSISTPFIAQRYNTQPLPQYVNKRVPTAPCQQYPVTGCIITTQHRRMLSPRRCVNMAVPASPRHSCKTTTLSVILSPPQLFCNSTANSLTITIRTASNLVTFPSCAQNKQSVDRPTDRPTDLVQVLNFPGTPQPLTMKAVCLLESSINTDTALHPAPAPATPKINPQKLAKWTKIRDFNTSILNVNLALNRPLQAAGH